MTTVGTLFRVLVLAGLVAVLVLSPTLACGCHKADTADTGGTTGDGTTAGGNGTGGSGGSSGGTTGGESTSGGSGSGGGPTVPAVTPDLSRLDPNLAPGYALAWVRPDGAIMLASPWYAEPKTLATDCGCQDLAWGHDGTYLLYLARETRDDAAKLMRLPLDGSAPTELAAFEAGEPYYGPDCSPDGRFWCCSCGTDVQYGLLVGGGSLAEPVWVGVYCNYAWSPDGLWLARGRAEPDIQTIIAIGSGQSSSVCLTNPETGEERVVVLGTERALYWPLAWPETNTLYYFEDVLAPDTASVTTFYQIDPFAAEPNPVKVESEDLPPSVAYADADRVRAAIPSDLPGGWGWTGYARWSPDGTALVINTQDAVYNCVIFVIDPATGAYGPAGQGYPPCWSPVPVASGW